MCSIALLAIWIVVTFLVISPLRWSGCSNEAAEIQEKLKRASSQLEKLQKQHNILINKKIQLSRLNDFKTIENVHVDNQGPSEEYENLRRRIHSNTKELWYYVNHELGRAITEDIKPERIQAMLEEVANRKRSLLLDQEKLLELGGYHEWQRKEASKLSDLVQRRLYYLQNPPDCKKARKLICNLNEDCSFGCQLHHVAYCLIFAYATERTLILNSKGWKYNNKGWENVFYPISDSCTSAYNDKVLQWPALDDPKVIAVPNIESILRKVEFLPPAVPEDIAHRIAQFNGDPSAWWIGQILKYILKLRAPVQKAINETIAKINFKSPIVGVHIRRMDKVGTESTIHHIDEYMAHVADYYAQLELTRTVGVRRVYLATDDANVLKEARQKYPQYTFYGNPSISKIAATHRIYTPLSLTGLLVDLHVLTLCDYIVCSFSSYMARVVYELFQSNRLNASESVLSLDDVYYFSRLHAHDRIAVMDNAGGYLGDISFEVDDEIGIPVNYWNGYGRAVNKRTGVDGLIPWFKTMNHLVLHSFPEYKQVPIYTDT